MPETPLPDRATQQSYRRLWAITLAGLTARLLFLALEPASRLAGDETTWVGWALKDLEGLLSDRVRFSPFRSEMIFYPPLYSYFIAAFYAVSGSLTAVKVAQSFVGALLVPAVGVIGIRTHGPRTGLCAATVTAFYPELVWFCAHFWSEILFMTLMLWGLERLLAADARVFPPSSPCTRSGLFRVASGLLWTVPPIAAWLAYEHRNVWIAGCVFVVVTLASWLALRRLLATRDPANGPLLVAGLLWALALLTRETLLYFTPIATLWIAWRRPRGAARSAVFVLTTLLVVAPWTYRNAVVFRAFVPVGTSGALNLWQGNTRLARSEVYSRTEAVHGETLLQNRIAQWRFHTRMAWEAIVARQPLWLYEKLRDEMPAFWEADSLALIHLTQKRAYGDFSVVAARTIALVVLVPYLAVLAFFVVGLAGLRATRATALLIAFLVYYNAVHVVAHGFSRYRLPIMPIVFLISAAAWTALRERRPILTNWKRRGVAIVLAASLAAALLPSLRRHMRDPAYVPPPASTSLNE